MLTDGIEVLSRTEIMLADKSIGRIVLLIGLSLFIIGVIGVACLKKENIQCILGMVAVVGFLLILISPIFIKVGSIPSGKYKYLVTISDEIKLLEFNSKYEIVGQNGKLYTIKDK